MKIQIVIGANYGDEGKGTVVDYLVNRALQEGAPRDCVVVRHNGGAQAGHTVVTPEGIRHVHSHFGCGTLQGVDTILGKFFVCNPMTFRAEYNALVGMGITVPKVYVDQRCAITTPFDVMINRLAETTRGEGRHGSVGVGFGETIERHGAGGDRFSLSVQEINDLTRSALTERLHSIEREWLPVRLRRLGVDPELHKHVPGVIERYIEDIQFFLLHVLWIGRDDLDNRGTIIFEGAQGLALDQHRGAFPYVTRSNTGVWNALELINYWDLFSDTYEAYYVTRSYTTRHGRGPLPGEGDLRVNVTDETNTTKEFQEHLRTAPLDIDAMKARIDMDLCDMNRMVPGWKMNIATILAMTCLDQVVRLGAFTGLIREEVGLDSMLMNFGPTRSTFKERYEWRMNARQT